MQHTLSPRTTREQRLIELQTEPRIQEMLALEPHIMTLFDIALSFDQPRDRWQAYSILKMLAAPLVGWNATIPALRDSQHYEAFIEAIDALLPDEAVATLEGEL